MASHWYAALCMYETVTTQRALTIGGNRPIESQPALRSAMEIRESSKMSPENSCLTRPMAAKLTTPLRVRLAGMARRPLLLDATQLAVLTGSPPMALPRLSGGRTERVRGVPAPLPSSAFDVSNRTEAQLRSWCDNSA